MDVYNGQVGDWDNGAWRPDYTPNIPNPEPEPWNSREIRGNIAHMGYDIDALLRDQSRLRDKLDKHISERHGMGAKSILSLEMIIFGLVLIIIGIIGGVKLW